MAAVYEYTVVVCEVVLIVRNLRTHYPMCYTLKKRTSGVLGVLTDLFLLMLYSRLFQKSGKEEETCCILKVFAEHGAMVHCPKRFVNFIILITWPLAPALNN
jgi:hypothetical protein